MSQSRERRFVNVKIEIQEADDQLRIFLQIGGDCLGRVAPDQFYLRHMPDKAVPVEQRNTLLQVIIRVDSQATRAGVRGLAGSILPR